jgi:hypothetical protein
LIENLGSEPIRHKTKLRQSNNTIASILFQFHRIEETTSTMCISSKSKSTPDKLKAAASRPTSSQTNNNRAQQEDPSSIVIPTFREERPRSLDVSSLTQSELAKLKTEDPFMYFSIPAVRIAELSGNDVDAPLAGTVSRMQRITAEAYPDIVVEDIVNNASLMERIVQEVQNEMEQERQQEAQEDDKDEEKEDGDDDMIQRYFNLLSENF